MALALPLSVIEGAHGSMATQLEVPSPSSLKNLLPPDSPVDLIAVPSGLRAGAKVAEPPLSVITSTLFNFSFAIIRYSFNCFILSLFRET